MSLLDVEQASDGWQSARLRGDRTLAPGVHEVVLEVPSWPGHIAGQYVDVRVRCDGVWSPPRSFSIANAPTEGTRVHLAVRDTASGTVSRHLVTGGRRDGLVIQVDGPKGDRMVWNPAGTGARPLLLIGGGTGIVPLIAIAREWESRTDAGPLCLIYSVRSAAHCLFREDLARLTGRVAAEVTMIVTGAEASPAATSARPAEGRLSALDLEVFGVSRDDEPECFVSGPASFVESVSRMLVEMKHEAVRIHTQWPIVAEVCA